MLKRTVSAGLVAAALLAAPGALAQSRWDRWYEHWRRHSVPEFDPAAGGALAVLLAGGALFIANRRRRK
jgi:hypothetical protein